MYKLVQCFGEKERPSVLLAVKLYRGPHKFKVGKAQPIHFNGMYSLFCESPNYELSDFWKLVRIIEGLNKKIRRSE